LRCEIDVLLPPVVLKINLVAVFPRRVFPRASWPAGGREQLSELLTDCGLCEPAVELYRVLLAEDSLALGISDSDFSRGQDQEHGFGFAFGLAFGLAA
jgi:hypothetical protein